VQFLLIRRQITYLECGSPGFEPELSGSPESGHGIRKKRSGKNSREKFLKENQPATEPEK
jgi:hypothetical protein